MVRFIKIYTGKESIKSILADVGHFVECGGDVAIKSYSSAETRILIDADEPEKFLHCVSKYVDDHTITAWERELEMQPEDFEEEVMG